jgi:DNA-binding SARP family transcriptional activator
MLVGRMASPLPDLRPPQQISIDWTDVSTVVVAAPHGTLHVGRFAADVLTSASKWWRVAPHETGEVEGPPFAKCEAAADLSGQARPLSDVLVVDLSEHDDEMAAARFLASAPALPAQRLLVLGSADHMVGVPDNVILRPARRTARDIRRSPGATKLDRPTIRRLWILTRGRSAFVSGLLRTVPRLGADRFARLVNRARTPDDLLSNVAAGLLAEATDDDRARLALTVRLGYAHDRLSTAHPTVEEVRDQPWWVPLNDDWFHVDPLWREPLLTVTSSAASGRKPLLDRLISELVEDKATDEAIELCLDSECFEQAAALIAPVAGPMVSVGRVAVLRRWLGRLGTTDVARAVGMTNADRDVERGISTHPASREEARSLPVNGHVEIEPVLLDSTATPTEAAPDMGATASAHEPRSAPTGAAEARGELRCRLLGRFEVAIDGQPLVVWQGNRGRMLFAYILLHRLHPLGREALAAAFWPDASPEAARNRLHVTLHSLRRDLRAVTSDPVVVFKHGYGLQPDLIARLDIEDFDTGVSQGRRCEAMRDRTSAVTHYEHAVSLYRGDLLEDAPYEEWTLLPREQYRVRFLQTLDRLASLLFDAGSYDECIEVCERLLVVDYCREDVHRMLIRSYARLNQFHLALRQFETCVSQLRAELNVAPDEETQRLVEQVRRREII